MMPSPSCSQLDCSLPTMARAKPSMGCKNLFFTYGIARRLAPQAECQTPEPRTAMSRTTTFAPAAGPVVTARGDVDLDRQPHAGFVTPGPGGRLDSRQPSSTRRPCG